MILKHIPYLFILSTELNPYSAGIDFSHQILTTKVVGVVEHHILTTKVYPRTKRVKIFLLVIDIGIQNYQKELIRTFMMISN